LEANGHHLMVATSRRMPGRAEENHEHFRQVILHTSKDTNLIYAEYKFRTLPPN